MLQVPQIRRSLKAIACHAAPEWPDEPPTPGTHSAADERRSRASLAALIGLLCLPLGFGVLVPAISAMPASADERLMVSVVVAAMLLALVALMATRSRLNRPRIVRKGGRASRGAG